MVISDDDGQGRRWEREVFAEILSHVKDFNGLSWHAFAAELSRDGKLFKITAEELQSVAWRKIDPFGSLIARVRAFVAAKETSLSAPMRADLARLVRAHGIPTDGRDNPPGSAFMHALGLQSNICERSASLFRGAYLHMALDDDANVVTSRCILSARLGQDQTPVYKSWRMIPSHGSRRYVGSYFCTPTHLYLVGTPLASVDIRLSLFSVVSGERQAILRGVVLGVSPRSTILTSRCMLVRADHVGVGLRRAIFAKPASRDRLDPELKEIGDYLYGSEKLPYIKESTGE